MACNMKRYLIVKSYLSSSRNKGEAYQVVDTPDTASKNGTDYCLIQAVEVSMFNGKMVEGIETEVFPFQDAPKLGTVFSSSQPAFNKQEAPPLEPTEE